MGSSGTRDGCPACKTALADAPAEPIAEHQCPRCAAALWALDLPFGSLFFVRRPDQSCAESGRLDAGGAWDLEDEEALSSRQAPLESRSSMPVTTG